MTKKKKSQAKAQKIIRDLQDHPWSDQEKQRAAARLRPLVDRGASLSSMQQASGVTMESLAEFVRSKDPAVLVRDAVLVGFNRLLRKEGLGRVVKTTDGSGMRRARH